jgi:AAA domain
VEWAPDALGGKDSHFEPSIEYSTDQYHAVKFIFGSQDLCVGLRGRVGLRGPVGAGKTLTLQQIRWGIHAAGKEVVAVAPSQTAVDELHKVGFHGAMTIDHLLLAQEAQQKLSGIEKSSAIIMIVCAQNAAPAASYDAWC